VAETFKAACVQTTSGPDVQENFEHAGSLIRSAVDAGADFVMLPEVVNVMDLDRKALAQKTCHEGADPSLQGFRQLASETGIWLLLGSIIVKHEEAAGAEGRPKFANRSFLLNPDGAIVTRYDKIHMFDVDLDGGESYRESSAYEPGGKAVTAETPWGTIGLSICYDLRFPYLYRHLAHAGARFLTIPAAFTRPTGKAHWHVLMRARAIETGCFVFAPAQCGDHGSGRLTFGHSLIVDPWGGILADAGDEPGHVMAEIDPAMVDEVRGKVPSINHDRDFA